MFGEMKRQMCTQKCYLRFVSIIINPKVGSVNIKSRQKTLKRLTENITLRKPFFMRITGLEPSLSFISVFWRLMSTLLSSDIYVWAYNVYFQFDP